MILNPAVGVDRRERKERRERRFSANLERDDHHPIGERYLKEKRFFAVSGGMEG